LWWVLATILALCAVLVGFRLRRNRIEALLPSAQALVPSQDSVAWTQGHPTRLVFEPTEEPGSRYASHDGTKLDQIEELDDIGYGAAALDAAIAAAPMLSAAELLNPDVMDALDRWVNHDQVFSGTQLFDYLHDHHDAIFSAESGPGFVAALQGFVGEQIAYHDLIARGDSVYMPDHTNVPAWDLNVDGQLFQVKVGDTALTHATQAAEAHPDIGIISDPLVASHFSDSIGLDNLAPEHLAHITGQTLESASVLAEGPSFHFPVITMVRSAWREVDLLSKNHTSGEIALKNAALDVAGVGGGAYVGGHFGATIGSFFTPLGAAIGAVIGAVGGAIGGRLFTDEMKHKAFKEAVARYTSARAVAEPVVDRAAKNQRRLIIDYVKNRDAELTRALRQEHRLFLAAARKARDAIQADRRWASKAFALHLGRLKLLVWDGFHEFERNHRSSWLHRTLLPTEGDVAIMLARKWARNASRKIEQLHGDLRRLVSSESELDLNEAAQKIVDFISTFECNAERYYGEIKVTAVHAVAVQQDIQERNVAYDVKLRSLIVLAQQQINAFIDAAYIRLSGDLRNIMAPVTEALETVRTEGRRLGKSI
jgi:hypothetical protein